MLSTSRHLKSEKCKHAVVGWTKEVKKGGEAAPNFKGGPLLRLHKTAAKHGEGANQQPAQPLLPLSLPLPTINRNPGLPHVVDALHMRTQICVTTCLTGASLGTWPSYVWDNQWGRCLPFGSYRSSRRHGHRSLHRQIRIIFRGVRPKNAFWDHKNILLFNTNAHLSSKQRHSLLV